MAWGDLLLRSSLEGLGLAGQVGGFRKSGQGLGSFPLGLQRLGGGPDQTEANRNEVEAIDHLSDRSQALLTKLRRLWEEWLDYFGTEDGFAPEIQPKNLEGFKAGLECGLRISVSEGLRGILLLASERGPVEKEVLEVALEELGYFRRVSQTPERREDSRIDWSFSRAWVEEPGRIFLNVIGRQSNGSVSPSEFERTRSSLSHDLARWAGENSAKTLGLKCLRPESVFGSISGQVPDLWITHGPKNQGSDLASDRLWPEEAGMFCWIPNPQESPMVSAEGAEIIESAGIRLLPQALRAHEVIDYFTGSKKEGRAGRHVPVEPIETSRESAISKEGEEDGEKLVRERLRALGYLE